MDMKRRKLIVVALLTLTACSNNEVNIARTNYDITELRTKCRDRLTKQSELLKLDTGVHKGIVIVTGIKMFRDEYILDAKKKDTTLYSKAVDYNVLQHDIAFLRNVILKDISRLKSDDQPQYGKTLDSLLAMPEL
jgi:hypothetical protein